MHTRMLRAALALVAVMAIAAPSASAPPTHEDRLLGNRLYRELRSQGAFWNGGDVGHPRALFALHDKIAAVASRAYGERITFGLLNDREAQYPDAFAVFGSQVYVSVRALYRIEDSQDEYAALLCNAVAHAIRHDDVVPLRPSGMSRHSHANGTQPVLRSEISTLLRSYDPQKSIFLYQLLPLLHFSQQQDRAADIAGVDVCAAAGFNPWAMIWLFKKFDSSLTGDEVNARLRESPGPGIARWLVNHRVFVAREDAIKSYIAANPRRFRRYRNDRRRTKRLDYRGLKDEKGC